jgi:hypothetical protein
MRGWRHAECPPRPVIFAHNVRVLDHFIIGEDGCFSFAEHGLL